MTTSYRPPSSASVSASAPLLDNGNDLGPSRSLSPSALPPPSPTPPPPPRLRRPYPLIPVSLLDLSYSIHHSVSTTNTGDALPTLPAFSALAVVRFVTLAIVCGASRRWRGRGGWVALACGGTLVGVVWDVCRVVLDKERQGGGEGGGGEEEGDVLSDNARFLVVTAATSIFEYLFFLLLLRLSPNPTRSGPVALRFSHSHRASLVQSPSSSTFSSRSRIPPEGYVPGPRFSVARPRSRRTSRISRPTSSLVVPSSYDGDRGGGPVAGDSSSVQPSFVQAALNHEETRTGHGVYEPAVGYAQGVGEGEHYHDEEGYEEGEEEEDGEEYDYGPNFDAEMGLDPNVPLEDEDDYEYDEYDHDAEDAGYIATGSELEGDEDGDDDDAESSVSESSIIDLPPARLSRIVPPTSLSLNAGLSLAGLDDSPVIGPLVRRTRSARILGTSFGSRNGEGSSEDRERGGGSGGSGASGVNAAEGYGTFGRV